MRFTLPVGPPLTFKARLHDARTATLIGPLTMAVIITLALGYAGRRALLRETGRRAS